MGKGFTVTESLGEIELAYQQEVIEDKLVSENTRINSQSSLNTSKHLDNTFKISL